MPPCNGRNLNMGILSGALRSFTARALLHLITHNPFHPGAQLSNSWLASFSVESIDDPGVTADLYKW